MLQKLDSDWIKVSICNLAKWYQWREQPYYLDLVEQMLETTRHTALGQGIIHV